MSKNAGRLSLGPLPRTEVVKVVIAVSVELKARLDAYAEVYGRLHGPVDAVALIPHMLEAFIARDRGFKRQLGGGTCNLTRALSAVNLESASSRRSTTE